MNAAGVQDTQRRNSTNIARADRTGLRVRAKFNEAIGPNQMVIGERITPTATSPVLARRFTPVGWNIAVEKRGFAAWVKAYAGQARNQVKREVSPHPQVVVVEGLPDHTCQSTRSESPT